MGITCLAPLASESVWTDAGKTIDVIDTRSTVVTWLTWTLVDIWEDIQHRRTYPFDGVCIIGRYKGRDSDDQISSNFYPGKCRLILCVILRNIIVKGTVTNLSGFATTRVSFFNTDIKVGEKYIIKDLPRIFAHILHPPFNLSHLSRTEAAQESFAQPAYRLYSEDRWIQACRGRWRSSLRRHRFRCLRTMKTRNRQCL